MKESNQFIVTVLCLISTSICIAVGESEWLEIIRIIFGTITLLFIPGRWLTKIFFSTQKIDLLERIALSFALSIAVVPLVVFYLNLIGIPINAWLVIGVVGVLVVISYGRFLYTRTKNNEKVTLI